VGSYLAYVEHLFEKGKFQEGSELWKRINYEPLPKQRAHWNNDMLKLCLRLRDGLLRKYS